MGSLQSAKQTKSDIQNFILHLKPFSFETTSHIFTDIMDSMEVTPVAASDENTNANGDPAANIPEIELIIKASTIDGRRKGACLFCHEYFMDLYLLAELKTISLKITTVDMLKPPPDFRSNFEATPPPILIDEGVAILENDRIERHIMKNIPGGHNIFVADKEVATKIENVFSKFKLMLLKKDEASKANLLSILRKINDHLEDKQSRFLTGETMCCFDCELMPKLQHIRVAGEFFTDFHIPGDLRALWRYFNEMYQLDAFTQSCPADQDIINHYKLQQGTKMTKREELEPPTFSNTVPTAV